MTAAGFAAAVMAAAVACAVPGDSAAIWMLRIAGAAFLTSVAPGAFTVLAWRPRPEFTLLELLGISVGIGVALVQLVTVAAVKYSWSVDVSLWLLAVWTVGHAVAAFRGRSTRTRIVTSGAEMALAGALLLLGGALYVLGSPFDTTEPRVHISLVQRLVQLSSPTPYTLYISPDVVYTYPFPGTHYLLALMSRVGGIDPFFLYYKTRAIWGMAAVTLLYGCALAMFKNVRLAVASALVAIALVANGAFGAVPTFSWGQLAPLSHASDIAMGVLLPALLLLSFRAIDAPDARECRFFSVAALGVAMMLVMVHPREIVQFLVYLTAFAVLATCVPPWRRMSRRALLLVAATLVALVVYRMWQQTVVFAVDDIVDRERSGLAQIFRDASISELFGLPLPLLRTYMIAFEPIFHGWNPLLLLVSPFVLFVLRRHALALLAAASILCYLLIIRFPILAIPYAYLTYFEILYTPIRNVIFFMHLLAGVSIYLVAARLSRFSTGRALALALATGVGAAAAISYVGPYLADHADRADWMFVPVFAGYAAVGWLAWRRRAERGESGWIDEPHSRWRLAAVAICIPLFAATELPESSLRNISWASPETPSALMSSLPCLDEGRFCAPPRALIRFVRANVPVDSVFAVDIADEYQPSLFMPQQMVAWPGTAEGLLPRVIFARYFERYDRAKAAYDEQPFFNTRESRDERLSFIRDLGVTHVLVNPRLHSAMTPVLAADPDVFRPLYDDGQWALYEVTMRYRGLRL